MAERGNQKDVGIARVDQDLADLLRVRKPDRLPRRAAIARAEHADSLGNVGAHVRFAGADVDRLRRGRRNRDRADRSDVFLVEDRLPGPPGIVGPPHAAVDRSEIEAPRVDRIALDGEDSAAPERPDRAPVKILEQRWVDARGQDRGRESEQPCGKQCERGFADHGRWSSKQIAGP